MWNDRHADAEEANKCGAAIPMSERCVECERPLFDDWKRVPAGRICAKCADLHELGRRAAEQALSEAFERRRARIDRGSR